MTGDAEHSRLRHLKKSLHHCWAERSRKDNIRPRVSAARSWLHGFHKCRPDCRGSFSVWSRPRRHSRRSAHVRQTSVCRPRHDKL